MGSFSIGVNALKTANQLIKVAGDNIANADTDGYHVREATVVAVSGPTVSGVRIGEGSAVIDLSRVRDLLVEQSLLSHSQVQGRLGQELSALEQIEIILSEPSEYGLDARLGGFFDSIAELTADPSSVVLREQMVQKAQSVCRMFGSISSELADLADSLSVNAEQIVATVNGLTQSIANLNMRIQYVETTGVSAPGLKDERDKLIGQLAELINVRTYEDEYGVVNVSCSGALLVSEGQCATIGLSRTEDGLIVAMQGGATPYTIDVQEGAVAGLLRVVNDLLPEYRSELDEMANAFRRSFNLLHTTSLGLAGRFHQLEGSTRLETAAALCDLGYGVPAGTDERLYVNVEDEATGDVTQYELTLDTTLSGEDFLVSLRDAVNASVGHVTASINEGRIVLTADDGYAFGLATPYDPNPAQAGDISALDPTAPGLLGAYTGDEDLAYEVSFLDGGEIGTDEISMQVTVRDTIGAVVRTFTRQIDGTYTPGSVIELDDGIQLTLGVGNVAAGDGFSFVARASMDTAGVLDALGLNTFFDGLGAQGIQVAARIASDPENVAGAVRDAAGDNQSLLAMARISSQKMLDSGSATLNEFYRAVLSNIGTTKNTTALQYDNETQLLSDLMDQRDSISGVSLDEEMISMMESQTIYQAALKFVSTVDEMLSELATIL